MLNTFYFLNPAKWTAVASTTITDPVDMDMEEPFDWSEAEVCIELLLPVHNS